MTTTRRAFLLASAAAAAACATPADVDEAVAAQPLNPLDGIAGFDGKVLPAPELLGKVTVVDFWASWCAPCRMAFPYMDQLYRTYVKDGLQVVGVSCDDDPQLGRRFAAMLRPRFGVAWDPTGAVRERFGVSGLPTTVLLDQQARLVVRSEGFEPVKHHALEDHVRRLVRGA
jgi:thiol-disulfide isomerase/thioredoxin